MVWSKNKQNGEQLSLLLFFVLDVAEKLMINVEKEWIDEDVKEVEITLSYNQYDLVCFQTSTIEDLWGR